ncbi:MAG: rod shape-determining protein MreD [Nitrospirae bacterium]|nr:rod shape-determining protein MreD [Nitrospirota bacterium]
MKLFAAILAVLIAFVLQTKVSLLSISPNLTVMLAYFAGMKYGETRGMAAGLVIGGIEDSLSSSIIGPNMMGKALAGFFASFFLSGGFFIWTPLLGILGAFLLTLVDNAVVYLTLGMFDRVPTSPSAALFTSVLQSLLNAAAGMFIRPPHAD